MRISTMITLKRNALILYQILSTNSLTRCMEISLENLYSKISLNFKGPVNIQRNLSLQTLVYCRYVMAFGGGHGGFWYLKLFFQAVFRSVIQIFMSNTGQYNF